jgi:hypothetical protein
VSCRCHIRPDLGKCQACRDAVDAASPADGVWRPTVGTVVAYSPLTSVSVDMRMQIDHLAAENARLRNSAETSNELRWQFAVENKRLFGERLALEADRDRLRAALEQFRFNDDDIAAVRAAFTAMHTDQVPEEIRRCVVDAFSRLTLKRPSFDAALSPDNTKRAPNICECDNGTGDPDENNNCRKCGGKHL